MIPRLTSKILLEIISHLSIADKTSPEAFRESWTALHTLLKITVAGLPQLRNVFACIYCSKLLHLSKFGLTPPQIMRKLKGRSFHVPPYCAEYGFNKPPRDPCGNNPVGYQRGSEAIVDGVRWVKCRDCEEVKKGDKVVKKRQKAWSVCRAVFEKKGWRGS